jgi:hypothetical protein
MSAFNGSQRRVIDAALLKQFTDTRADRVLRPTRNTVDLKPSRQEYVKGLAKEFNVSKSTLIAFAVEWLRVTETEARLVLKPTPAYDLSEQWGLTPEGQEALQSIRSRTSTEGRKP